MAEPVVVVVEDEPQIRKFLRAALAGQGYRVFEAGTGEEGLIEAASRQPDVVIVDLGLPDIDGLQVITRLREWSAVPIIVLSARGQEGDKIRALDAGADDYVTKPFGMDELMARVRAALRHAVPADELAVIETPDFTIDLAARKATRQGHEVRFTPTEWQVVELLARNPGRLITHRHMVEEVWGLKEAKTNYVRVFMVAIRKKLEPDPAQPRYFITEPGSGIRFLPKGVGHQL